MNFIRPFTRLLTFLLVFLIISVYSFAQYPDRYVHFRAIPDNSFFWKLALESYANEKFDSALHYSNAAESIFNEREEWESMLFINNFKAQLLGELGKPKDALRLLDSVRSVFANLTDTLLSIEYTENLFLSARVSSLTNDYSSTENFLNRTISLLTASGSYPEILSIVYFTLWQLHSKIMNIDLANRDIAKAIGNLNSQNNHYSKAILYYIQAERLDKTQLYLKSELYIAAAKAFELSNSKVDYLYYFCLLKLSQQFSSFQSDYEKAIYYGKLAEEYMETNRITNVRKYSFYFALGEVYRSFGQYSNALPYLIKANEITKSVFGSTSFEYLLSNIYLGRLYRYMGDYEKSGQYLYSALSIGRTGWKGKFPHEFTLYGQLGRLYSSWEKPDSALFYAQVRLKYEHKVDTFSINQIPPTPKKSNIIRYYNSLVVKIEAYKQLYQLTRDTAILTQALAHCNHAIGLLTQLNEYALEENSGLKNSTRTKVIASYAIYFIIEKSNGSERGTYIKDAISFSEASNANYLKYLINLKNEEVVQQPNEVMMLRKMIDEAEKKLKQSKKSDYQNESELYDSTLNLKIKLANLILNDTPNKEHYNSMAGEKPFELFKGIDSLQQCIPNSTAILISHIDNFDDKNADDFDETNLKSTKKLVTFYIDKGSVDFSVIPLNEEDEEVFNQYLRSLKTGDNQGYSHYGQILFNLLYQPFWHIIKSKSNLVVIPDERLADIPMESIPTDSNQTPVCSTISVSHHYSLGLWENSSKSTRISNTKSILAVAPDFSDENGKTNATTSHYEAKELNEIEREKLQNVNRLSLLPMAKQEVLEIEAMFSQKPNLSAEVITGSLTKQQFIETASQFDIICIWHFK